jgi:16S rRNA (adenine1518-N6/adenine1519-N6)-dimethyltransferase
LVVANLPYYITSAVLRHVLEARVKPARVVVMVQKEVADRIVAPPGQLSTLAVAVAYFARATVVARVPASAFYPAPKVNSAILRLDVHSAPPVNPPSEAAFFRVVRAGFSQRRKQLRNSLASGLALDPREVVRAMAEAGVSPDRRAQTLSLEEWAALSRSLAKSDGSD